MVFVVDDTGSMSAEIEATRQQINKIVNHAIIEGRSPAYYVLSTFNDPGNKFCIAHISSTFDCIHVLFQPLHA